MDDFCVYIVDKQIKKGIIHYLISCDHVPNTFNMIPLHVRNKAKLMYGMTINSAKSSQEQNFEEYLSYVEKLSIWYKIPTDMLLAFIEDSYHNINQ